MMSTGSDAFRHPNAAAAWQHHRQHNQQPFSQRHHRGASTSTTEPSTPLGHCGGGCRMMHMARSLSPEDVIGAEIASIPSQQQACRSIQGTAAAPVGCGSISALAAAGMGSGASSPRLTIRTTVGLPIPTSKAAAKAISSYVPRPASPSSAPPTLSKRDAVWLKNDSLATAQPHVAYFCSASSRGSGNWFRSKSQPPQLNGQ